MISVLVDFLAIAFLASWGLPQSFPFHVMGLLALLQYVWVQEWRARLIVSMVKMTLAVDFCDETSPVHLLEFALKMDIRKVRSNRSYSCETIL